MSGWQGGSVSQITSAQVAQVADSGLWGVGPSLDPAAVDVGQALVAVLQDAAPVSVLTADLQQLLAEVRQVATVGFPWIEGAGGVRLSAHTIKLAGDEPRPVVIVPAGWTPFGWVLFEYTYLQLALRGYHVLAYTPRGIGTTTRVPGGGYLDAPWTSGGTIDVGGPKDQADGFAVIAYAREVFRPSALAFLGESYGSGISQLVAAHDEAGPVAAVVALSTWGDLAEALLGNSTRHLAAVDALINLTGGPEERKFDPDTRQLLDDFKHGLNLEQVRAWARERSPLTHVENTNKRSVPTFISNTWHETLFPVNQVLETFNALEAPKHLNLWIGDHAAPESSGLIIPLSGPSVPVHEALAWLDHHVLGTQNEVLAWPLITAQVMFEPALREEYDTWPEPAGGSERLYLGPAAPGSQDGTLDHSPQEGWTAAFTTGTLTEATAVDALLSTGQAEWNGEPKTYVTGKFDRRFLATWISAPGARRIRGIPRLHLTATAFDQSATLVAYLFDLAPDGTARIITHEPNTLTSLEPGQASSATWQLQAASYDLGDQHRVMLVVNAKDRLYSDANSPYSTLTISSPDGDESWIELPLG